MTKNAHSPLESVNKRTHSYVDNIGHGLKTPLNAINTLSNLLLLNEQSNLTVDQLDQLSIIHRSGETLAILLDELVSLFRLHDSGLPLDVDELSLHTLVSAVQSYFDVHLEGKSITLELTVDPLLPVIETDNQKLLKVLRNLLDNAIRFTTEGVIKVAVMSGDNDNYPVVFQISDTGIGIPADRFEEIFGAFRQLDETAKRQHDGLGLGLTIAKSYTHLLGGYIELSSEVGKGTVFTIKLPESPFQQKKPAQLAEPALRATVFLSTTPTTEVAALHLAEGGSERAILLVDDDYRNQYAMKAMIEEAKGNKVLIAQDGSQAIQLLKDHPEIQLVITDIAMPEMDGYDLIHYIRENKVLAYLPIIAVTAMPETDRERILSTGANAYLRKPITMDKFFQLLKHCKNADSICT